MPLRSQPLQTVIDFCLEHALQAPVHKRVSLYLGLAEFCADPQEAASFKAMAESLASADQQCREFAFQIQNPKGAPKTNGQQ